VARMIEHTTGVLLMSLNLPYETIKAECSQSVCAGKRRKGPIKWHLGSGPINRIHMVAAM